MFTVTMKQLMEAGVHFGHQANRWNPKMKKYIFIERNGIYIIDLQKTLRLFKDAYQFVREIIAQGGTVLFVGTKRQAQDVIEEEAARCSMPYINQRWLGGMLTNYNTIQKSLSRLQKLEEMKEEGTYTGLKKKEISKIEKKREKMDKVLKGIKGLNKVPDALFLIDTKRERIAVNEANKLEIPVIAILDTNSDPEGVNYHIPGNDDAIRSLKIITSTIADAVIEGQGEWLARQTESEEEKEEVDIDMETEMVQGEVKKARVRKIAQEEDMEEGEVSADTQEALGIKEV